MRIVIPADLRGETAQSLLNRNQSLSKANRILTPHHLQDLLAVSLRILLIGSPNLLRK